MAQPFLHSQNIVPNISNPGQLLIFKCLPVRRKQLWIIQTAHRQIDISWASIILITQRCAARAAKRPRRLGLRFILRPLSLYKFNLIGLKGHPRNRLCTSRTSAIPAMTQRLVHWRANRTITNRATKTTACNLRLFHSIPLKIYLKEIGRSVNTHRFRHSQHTAPQSKPHDRIWIGIRSTMLLTVCTFISVPTPSSEALSS